VEWSRDAEESDGRGCVVLTAVKMLCSYIINSQYLTRIGKWPKERDGFASLFVRPIRYTVYQLMYPEGKDSVGTFVLFVLEKCISLQQLEHLLLDVHAAVDVLHST